MAELDGRGGDVIRLQKRQTGERKSADRNHLKINLVIRTTCSLRNRKNLAAAPWERRCVAGSTGPARPHYRPQESSCRYHPCAVPVRRKDAADRLGAIADTATPLCLPRRRVHFPVSLAGKLSNPTGSWPVRTRRLFSTATGAGSPLCLQSAQRGPAPFFTRKDFAMGRRKASKAPLNCRKCGRFVRNLWKIGRSLWCWRCTKQAGLRTVHHRGGKGILPAWSARYDLENNETHKHAG